MIRITNTKKILLLVTAIAILFVIWLLWLKPLPRANATQCQHNCWQPSPTPSITPHPSHTPRPSHSPKPTINPCILVDVWELKKDEVEYPCPSATPEASGSGEVHHDQLAPPGLPQDTCNATTPTRAPANFHIYRNGTQAEAKWFVDTNKEGDQVTIYYGVNGYGVQYSLRTANDGSETINLYDTQDYTFWAAVTNSCTDGPRTSAVVDGNTQGWVLFR